MTADYNGWADRPEDEREAEEAAEETFVYPVAGSLRPAASGARPGTQESRSPR
jgi:hypothetical protein